MEEESRTLREEADAHNESEEEIQRRIDGGWELVRERFELKADEVDHLDDELRSLRVGDREVVSEGQLVSADIEEIRAIAREQSARLWRRMSQL